MKLSADLACCTSVQTDIEIGTGGETANPEQLTQRLANGDPNAPGDLVQRHYPELYRYALGMLRDRTAAQDAVQSSFENALTALGHYSEERIRTIALRPWLYRIVLNVVRNMVRRQKWEVPLAEVPERPRGGRPAASKAGDKKDVHEAWLDVVDALGHLPERQRTAVILRYLADMPYGEISEVTGWPEGTAKTLVRRGLGRLQVLLLDEVKKAKRMKVQR